MFCLLTSAFYFIDDKIAADLKNMKLHPSLKGNYRLQFSQNVALNRVRETGKPRCKLLYELLREEDGYDPLLDIFPYLILI